MRATENACLEDRLRGAIWGQFVGDAACLGSHWIYDPVDMRRRYPRLQGFEEPAEGHYHAGKRPGDQTHYGDAAVLLLQSIAALGRFDPRDFGRRFVALMGSADYRGYRDHATRETLAVYQARYTDDFDFQQGANDDQPATVTRLAPAVVAHLVDADWQTAVDLLTLVCQNSHRARAYARAHAALLRALLAGKDLATACAELAAALQGGYPMDLEVADNLCRALASAHLPVAEAAKAFGLSCPHAQSFPAAVQAALAHAGDFPAAVLATLEAGGDNAGRAAMIGSWLGASLGLQAIPADWRDRLSEHRRITRATETIVQRTLATLQHAAPQGSAE
ncbi:MAG: ADP-ribosylglycohydrolase family protein [Methylococcaceae bacterium]|nr:ADP-ribosylglycohydrolase family protein [Methylococcaceae bacterium]